MATGSALRKIAFTTLVLAAASSAAFAQGRPTRFWNLTRHTISEFYLAPTGTTNFGPNQCKNDKDGTVDPDERLRISGIGLISLPSGMKPETIARSVSATGNGRAAIARAAVARTAAGNASRRSRACARSSAFASSIAVD